MDLCDCHDGQCLVFTILTRGPVRLSYMIQQLKQVKRTAYLQISSFLSGVAEVTRTLGTVVAGFFVHGALAWTYHIAIGLSLVSILLIFLMKEPETKSDEKRSLNLKTDIGGGETRMAGETGLILLDAHLSTARNHHVYVLFLLPTENQ